MRHERDRDRELERRLRDVPLPDEAEAEERSWEVVRAAYEERTPVRPTYRARRFALAVAAGAVLLAIGLSPAGAQMGDWVRDVVGEEDAKPELSTLPAAGEILVEGADGVWIVRDDGSKRRLGDYDEATWSPNGFFVAVTAGNRLLAVTPEGDVRWEIEAPATVHDPRWTGTERDTRIAYRSGGDLWVVAGDGSGERLIARGVAPVPPAWRPLLPEAKVETAPEDFEGVHLLTYVDAERRTHTINVDTNRTVPTTRQDLERLSAPPSGGPANRAFSPDGRRFAIVERVRSRDQLVLMDRVERGKQVLFSALGNLTGPTWSPDGRWILVGWPEADQWLFINADDPTRVKPFENIAEQFGGEASTASDFPRVAGWILPQR
jgi:hypothetical protein